MQSTIAANGMQRVLCEQDDQISRLMSEYAKAKSVKTKADAIVSDSRRREKNLEKEVTTLQAQTGEIPSLQTQLSEANAMAARL